ncbi:agrin, partial [Aplysia californica]|uniref:Agrin n=1 Tax=Aplysia californica TaxID=6500 RepID=A0ABM0KAH7_APLCA
MFRGEVEIKRIFKGGQVLDTLATITPGLLRQHKMVMVEGFGDPEICDNVVKERDTKIFMLSPNGNGELKLNSSVVPLTLHNLDYVDSVVNHLPFITEKPKQISPCYLYFCPFGATCRVDEETMTPMCVCERKCSKIFAPVCGTDMVTYSNLCMLERASCIHNKLIKVKSHGVCGVRDPCEGHVCKFGAECLPSQDGERARCQCPNDCPSYGDHVGSQQICGNDGKDYANMCEMRKAACYQLKDIRIKYHGKCDPCQGHTCEAPKLCQVGPAPAR